MISIEQRREAIWGTGAVTSPRLRRRLGTTTVVEGYDSGVVCQSGFLSASAVSATIHLWDPSRNLFWELPSPPTSAADSCGRNANYKLGVGRDPSTGDFKVVRVCSPMHLHPSSLFSHLHIFGAGTEVSVYSLRENSWRAVEWVPLVDPDLPGYSVMFTMCFGTRCVVVNSCLHWSAWIEWVPSDKLSTPKDCTWVKTFRIIAFDLATEAFRLIPPPREVTQAVVKDGVTELFGHLALVVRDQSSFQGPLDIWIMRRYNDSTSWTKTVSLNISGSNPLSGSLYRRSRIDVASNGQAKIWTSWCEIDYDLTTQTVLHSGPSPSPAPAPASASRPALGFHPSNWIAVFATPCLIAILHRMCGLRMDKTVLLPAIVTGSCLVWGLDWLQNHASHDPVTTLDWGRPADKVDEIFDRINEGCEKNKNLNCWYAIYEPTVIVFPCCNKRIHQSPVQPGMEINIECGCEDTALPHNFPNSPF